MSVDFVLERIFWAWRQKGSPTDRAPQFERIGFWAIVFGISANTSFARATRLCRRARSLKA
ncbi:hypothetical protein MPNT_200042 [Candidatus Methylacidithermus pantelleriae]|uniref:Uncharacterized protein n=1 Tax=Candidatus Methylacidithermus pantelleriae TaxID=2744239 RepID=A0A8J2FNN1_9BACT|nr:hypothetical protein MPNT_200042 [Candidatus Methylacidithermus pantelleriae]